MALKLPDPFAALACVSVPIVAVEGKRGAVAVADPYTHSSYVRVFAPVCFAFVSPSFQW